MRIAYVCADAGIPVFGNKGASVHVQGVIAALQRAGHHVSLFAARSGATPPATPALQHVTIVEPAPADDLGAREEAQRDVNARLAEALAGDVPFDLVYERYALWGGAGVAAARRWGVPGVLEVNAPLIEEQRTHRALGDVDAAVRSATQAFGDATLLVAVSQAVAQYLKPWRSRRAPVLVVPNGVEPSRFPLPAYERPRAGRPFTMGFVGTLKPWHGVELLAEALAELRRMAWDARLLVVGDGPARATLRSELERRGVWHAATITGAVDPAEVAHYLTQCDVALAPYPPGGDSYFSPLKVVEYLAAGVPVVASRIGQVPALVRHGVTGLLFPPGDARAAAAACNRLRLDRPLALAMGREGRREILATRTWDAVVQRILSAASHPMPRLATLARPGAADAAGVVA